MAKRTSIIDIGSNSARMAVFEKTSRFGFHLIKEIKSRVRIGEGAYEKGGFLQEVPMQRAYDALREFMQISQSLKCRKNLCVATSALRDAPNAREFINKIKKDLNLHIKIIDGKEEAYFGGVASLNLLAPIHEATTIDIGGGSTELAKIKDGRVVDAISLDIGTVRLKELFYDNKKSQDELFVYLKDVASKITKSFFSKTIFGIGGTLRALSSSIMEKEDYPLQTVHGFKYEFGEYEDYIKEILNSSVLGLKKYPIKKDRFDTIREGCAIFYTIAKQMEVKNVVTNGAGVREGVYLCDLLRGQNHRFPKNFNPSLKSLLDRFATNLKDNLYVSKKALELFDVLKPLHNIDDKYRYELSIAGKLYNVGQSLSFYQYHSHGYHFILNNLNFGFTHNQKILIALLIKYHAKKLPKSRDLAQMERILPDVDVVNWLSFILSFAKSLDLNLSQPRCSFFYSKNTLQVRSENNFKLTKEAVKKLVKPASFAIVFR
ncbi:MAG: guanosine polyphosphate pyrophosphohydrolase [Proteobacteria bacterium]|nr:MAG: guanosine polyphosphate pyrophosphohydrolase [Pseudomonadota bacterium]